MKFKSVLTIAVIAFAFLTQTCTSLPTALDNGNYFTQDEIRHYFDDIPHTSSKEGVHYDIIDIWDQPSNYPGKIPFRRSVPHLNRHDIHFTAFQEDFHLRLSRNHWLARDGLRMETLSSNGSVVSSKEVRRDCYYFGEVLSHNSSSAAISKCDGLSGVISYGQHDMYIKPLRSDHAEQYKRRRRDAVDPHIVYRRSADDTDQTSHSCGTENGASNVQRNQIAEELMAADIGAQIKSNDLQKYMELMITVDAEMQEFHGANLESYVMTVLNIVARRFVDDSFGATLRLHLVKFFVLDEGSSDSFSVTSNGQMLLDNFCEWQQPKNIDDDRNPEHWDNAVFMTRRYLYSSSTSTHEIQGKAWRGGTCILAKQCSVSRDKGLGSALTVTHEIGHTLGLEHDIAYDCTDSNYMMATVRSAVADAFSWSTCSKAKIQDFFRKNKMRCLNDEPSGTTLVDVNELPGTRYTYADQCRLINDMYLPYSEVDCSMLWCLDPTRGKLFASNPAMEGTTCGTDKWCIEGECVQREPLHPVDGQWSAWRTLKKSDPLGQCSRTCGGGVRVKKIRYCNNPPPSNGGNECRGKNAVYVVCKKKPCATTQDEFRDEQCLEKGGVTLTDGKWYQYIGSYTSGLLGDDLCTLHCQVRKNGFNTLILPNDVAPDLFKDGTRCWHGTASDAKKLKMCVGGKCKSF